MPFDWGAIRGQASADLAFYRLLGEMLQRRASPADLERVRRFLDKIQPGPDAWHTLGEALFHTSNGSVTGFRLWCSWSHTLEGVRFTEEEHRGAWERFKADLSNGLEETTDEPDTIQFESDAEDLEEIEEVEPIDPAVDPEIDSDSVTRALGAAIDNDDPFVDRATAELLKLLPTGPYTIRLFGEVWEGIDELTLLELARRGVFLGTEVLLAARWVDVTEHPGFRLFTERLRGEAHSVLGRADIQEAEVTRPGSSQ